MKKILVVEDDLNLGTALVGFLEMQKYEVYYVSNGDEAIAEFQQFSPDLVTLDVMLNCSIDGFEIARKIRKFSDVPIIFTTSRDGNEDYEIGFGIGLNYVKTIIEKHGGSIGVTSELGVGSNFKIILPNK